MSTKILMWTIIIVLAVICLAFSHACHKIIYARIKEEARKELIAEEAEAEFYDVTADLKQHLKDDGFIEPKPGSEEHYQRWKAERESRES